MKKRHHKEKMKTELSVVVQTVLDKYRVVSHRGWDKAIDDVCAELQSMKHERFHRCVLLTDSEWLNAKHSQHRRRLSFVAGIKRLVGA